MARMTPTPTRSGRRTIPRRARVLPGLAVLFIVAAAIRLGVSASEAFAQDPVQRPPVAQDAPIVPAPPIGASPISDAQLSLEIRDRERIVLAREAALGEREALLAAAQLRLQAQIDALQTAEAELAATMALADRAAEDDITRLVSVFQAMSAEEAAAVFAEMDPEFAAGFLGRLAPESAAPILAGLDPRQAYGLSVLLAGRNALVPRN